MDQSQPLATPENIARLRALNPRLLRLSGLVAQGYQNKKIAEDLGVSEATVKQYMCRIFQHLELNEGNARVRLAMIVVANRLISTSFGGQWS